MAKLVDAPDLGSGVARRVGSSPIRRTFLADFPFDAHRKGFFFVHTQGKAKDNRHEHADLHAPAENVVHVSRFRRRLFRRFSRPFATVGRKHKTPPDF